VKLKLHHNKNRLGLRPRPQRGSLQRSPTTLAGFQFIGPSGLYCQASIVGPLRASIVSDSSFWFSNVGMSESALTIKLDFMK